MSPEVTQAAQGADNLDNAQLLSVLMAFKKGDFSARMPLDRTGVAGKVADTLNEIIAYKQDLAQEFERVSQAVGKEGKISQRLNMNGEVSGAWSTILKCTNSIIADLLQPITESARVIGAVAKGDLTQTMTAEVEGRPLQGEFLQVASVVNGMVEQLGTFAGEVSRVAREVGAEGKLGGQAVVKGLTGTWKDLTDNANSMAANLTNQVRNIAEVTTAVASGDLSRKVTVDVRGEILQLKDAVNTMVDQLRVFAAEVTRVAREVGTEGKLGGQAVVLGVGGTWKDLTDSVNSMAANLTNQVRNIAEVTTAVANGDLARKITVEAKGEILGLADTINAMVDRLNAFASEVTRVAREVGTDGKLGGQAQVQGVGGTWKDLTENVNQMARNLTDQVRNIAEVTTAVANGDLNRKITVEAKGEILELKNTINTMVDQLNGFASEVTRVAREVGSEGKLGGQALVPGAQGTWRDLTDNVNQLAANLTTQVRAIADVATAVTAGDLSRSVAVEAAGEVASLKDNINEMIRNLRDTTQRNSEQDWLKTNLAKVTRTLQGQRDLFTVSKQVLSELAPLVSAQHGVFYLADSGGDGAGTALRLLGSYAYKERKDSSNIIKLGDGLVGQCALEKERILLTNVPSDYVQVSSGLGQAAPQNIVVLPVLFEGQVRAVVELASFNRFTETQLAFLEQLTESIGIVLNTISATMRTEELLKQSQALTEELQSQQEELSETNKRLEEQARSLKQSEGLLKQQQGELQQANEELEERAGLLGQQKAEVETKNREVEQARLMLQEKAEQLTLTSKYKSEFLANMSHELRTPLNSMLILSKMLAENKEGNLTEKQKEQAKTVHAGGADLLELINDILDLSKIESRTVGLEVESVLFTELREYVKRNFQHVAEAKGIGFSINSDPSLPRTISTDAKRLQQVLKNLLSNAIKFTEKGSISLSVNVAPSGWRVDNESLNRASAVVAFAVADTGIGISKEKHRIIFEAFQQADGSTSRKYGGTGLGLPISREIAGLLGGEIKLESEPGQGSTFTLYLPVEYLPQPEKPLKGTPPAPRVAVLGGPGGAAEGASQAALTLPAVEKVGQPFEDDRETIQPGERVLLIVEDDVHFARILLDLARERGFKGVVVQYAREVMQMVKAFSPSAITLDIRLPDREGWTVLDQLKHDPAKRHIPVEIISVEDERQRGVGLGAIACLKKPVSKEALEAALNDLKEFAERPLKRLLVVEDDEAQRKSIADLIGDGDVEIVAVATGGEALTALRAGKVDCMVLDLSLPDMTGFDVLDKMKEEFGERAVPVVVYTGRELTPKEETELKRYTEAVVIKDAKSPERLLAETALFLHRVESRLPARKQQMLEHDRDSDPALVGKKVLIVDDDVRNIFALTTALERRKMAVVHAEKGKDALALLKSTPDIQAVLMDIMMPEMDGYETTCAIRKIGKFKKLPIIAVTAKAMRGDREKCIEVGASDYIAKPVDVEQLLSPLRVWLYR